MEVIDAVPRKLKTKALPWETVNIMPVGDIQMGSPGVDKKRLREHIKWGVDHGVFFIGTGDYTDFLSPSNRRFLKNAGLYDTASDLIERWHREHMEEVKEILKPTIGMWMGLHEGHHYFEYGDGTTSDTDLAHYLDAPFLGTCAVTRLQFKGGSGLNKNCLIWSHHGEGSGNNPLLRLKAVAPGFPQVDVFIQGHNTKIAAEPLDVIEFYGSPMKMRDRTQLFVAAGGFMRGYQMGGKYAGRAQGSYVEKGMMRPSSIGGVIITVTPKHRSEYNELDIHASV